jgi:hypothetical protein
MDIIVNERIQLSLLDRSYSSLAKDYFLKNKIHLSSTMPDFSSNLFEEPYWKNCLKQNVTEYKNDNSLRLFLSLNNENKVIGIVNFTEIQRGAFRVIQ